MTTAFNSLHFASPLWLVVAVGCAAVLTALEVRLGRARKRAVAEFSARTTASTLSRPRRITKAALTVVGASLICVALARPQLGYREEETYRRGLDLMFVLDTSKSMLTPDVPPNRLTRAKLALYDLTTKFQGDRVGLVAFAGDAFLQCPLTLDRAMFDQTLDAVDTSSIPRGGTDLGRAIAVGVDALHSQPENRKLLIVLTDGEDLEEGALSAAQAAAKAGVRIYTVGVGTANGDLIPLPGGTFVTDASGAFVRSRLDSRTLSAIAEATGGQYRPLGPDGRGLELLYQDVLDKLPRDTVGERMHRIPLERFGWPLGLAALCLTLEALLRERRPPRRASKSGGGVSDQRFRGRPAAGAALALLAATGLSARAQASVSQAEQDYRAGKYPQAAEEYRKAHERDPADSRLQLNVGDATYKAGDYTAAGAALQGALHAASTSGQVDLQQRAYYDLGNSEYRQGEKTRASDAAKTLDTWKEAVKSYDGALALNPKDADAAFNRAFVQQKIAELEKQQQQQKPQQNQDQKNPRKQSGQDQQQAKNGAGDSAPKKPGQSQANGRPDQKSSGEGQSPDRQAGAPKSPGQQQANNAPGNEGQSPGQPSHPSPNPPTSPPQAGQQSAQQGREQPRPGGAGDQEAQGNPNAGDDAAQDASQQPPTRPGQLSRADARALLNSLRGDERLMTAEGPDTHKTTDEPPVQKDW